MPSQDNQDNSASLEVNRTTEQLMHIIEGVSDGFLALDRDWRITYLNAAGERIIGRSRKVLVGDVYWTQFPMLLGTQIETELRRAMTQRIVIEFENYWEPLDRWFSIRILPDNDGGLALYYREVTQEKNIERSIREAEANMMERYRALYEDNPSMYFTVSLEGKVLSLNRFGATQLGYVQEDLVGKMFLDICYEDDQQLVLSQFDLSRINSVDVTHWEFRTQRKNDEVLWVRANARCVQDIDGEKVILIVCDDIAERKKIEQKLLHGAYHDALTGLPNQALFLSLLEKAIGSAKRHENYLFAVLFLDLDRFKIVNDSLGHLIGDQLLIAIAQRLKVSVRPGDTVARFGGDEFTILITDIKDISEAVQVAERVQQELRIPLLLDGQEVYTSASIGIAMNTHEIANPDDILRDADIAMYRAKVRGKARYEIFDHDMYAGVADRWVLESDLRRALERRELEVYYQPIISLTSGDLTGVEALLRWQHPQRGLIYPDEFIGLAEETGLIGSIGEWSLRVACTQLKAWQTSGYPKLQLSLNCSALQFQNDGLAESIKAVLTETRLVPATLKIEITESLAMKNIHTSIATLHELSALGVQISIDDFGTGYSSLAYLKRFPIDTLKIDHSFVKDMTNNSDDAAITEAIIAMAHSLKLDVVAEGVETEQQLTLLRSQNCDSMQGFLFSEAVNAETFSALLIQGKGMTSFGVKTLH